MRKSALTVTYPDLLSFAEKALASAEKKLAGAKACGAYSLQGLTHEVEVAKTLVRMLKKGLPAKQTDMFELFNQAKR